MGHRSPHSNSNPDFWGKFISLIIGVWLLLIPQQPLKPKQLVLKSCGSSIIYTQMQMKNYTNRTKVMLNLKLPLNRCKISEMLTSPWHISIWAIQWTVHDSPWDRTLSTVDSTPVLFMQLTSLSGGVWDRDMSVRMKPVVTTKQNTRKLEKQSVTVWL